MVVFSFAPIFFGNNILAIFANTNIAEILFFQTQSFPHSVENLINLLICSKL